MDDELLGAIKEVKALAEDNNKILHGMRRNARIARVWRIFYWLIILGTGVASYYYLQPYINSMTQAYKNIQAAQDKVGSFDIDSFKNYFSGGSTK